MRRHRLNDFDVGEMVTYVGIFDPNSVGKSGVVLHINGRGVCAYLEGDPHPRWFLYKELEHGSNDIGEITYSDFDALLAAT